ncbi:TetR family transcriptional regulator [Mycolicibacterium wolinskyi]|uniref:TetR family transcriptional regulator n=1 Tax=Mycolicibacterium wolinskyi TaxID=59750 RepID=A0A132PPA6_9MYCO|nr:TetR/AcrR family transcriptional regulator [Mycolicibacterium wolinskyi]KWX24145.1 TetR family transcriptional regulator [Mycolicibacterium wolinskyi]
MAGRPREFDRDAALRTMQELFWRHGFEGVSMADLVAATGLASARLYAAFGSKEQMFREAVELYMQTEGGFADRTIAEEPTLADALRRMLRDAVDVYAKPHPRGCMVVAAATNCTPGHEEIREWLEKHRHERAQSITRAVRAAKKSGELRPDADVQQLGDYFATVLNGLSVQARDGVSPRRLRAVIEPAIAVLPLR